MYSINEKSQVICIVPFAKEMKLIKIVLINLSQRIDNLITQSLLSAIELFEVI